MFILKKEATFTHPIIFYTPGDGGSQNKETFDILAEKNFERMKFLKINKSS